MKKKSVLAITLTAATALIFTAPLFFSDRFSFELNYFIDDELCPANTYEVSSNYNLSESGNKYIFDKAEQANYIITVKPFSNDNGTVVFDFINCTGYDLRPSDIYFDIDIKINSQKNEASVSIKDKHGEYLTKQTVKANENNEYFVHWTNA